MNYIILIILGYLIGSIPCSYLVSRMLGHIDIREHGSGNSGATNVFRTLGKKAGIYAFIGDFLKGLLAAVIGRYILGEEGALLCSTFAVLGHCYPFTIAFKGGKGVATTIGMIFGINPLIGIVLIGVQIVIIAITRYMSLASIISAAMFPLIVLLMAKESYFLYYSIFLGLFVIYRHRLNLARLLNGSEKKLVLKQNK
ncbi:MAG: glycerol-3-phosphate 1-O-acyltransferase PlsY [Acidaminobacteraceae bacterium]